MDRLEKAISILSDDFSFDENGIMEITREAVNEIVELMKEQQAIIDQYHQADTFLATHGWQWKTTTTDTGTSPKDGDGE